MEDSNNMHARAYFNLLKTGSWIEEKIKEAIRPYDLTHAQLNVLYILVEHDPAPVSANALKEGILVSKPDMTRLIDRLVKKEYVLRETCPQNRRKIDVSLTDTGRAIFKEAHIAAKHALGNFFLDRISLEEAAELRRILHKLRE